MKKILLLVSLFLAIGIQLEAVEGVRKGAVVVDESARQQLLEAEKQKKETKQLLEKRQQLLREWNEAQNDQEKAALMERVSELINKVENNLEKNPKDLTLQKLISDLSVKRDEVEKIYENKLGMNFFNFVSRLPKTYDEIDEIKNNSRKLELIDSMLEKLKWLLEIFPDDPTFKRYENDYKKLKIKLMQGEMT